MSAYSQQETSFKDVKLLCLALAELGFDSSMVRVFDTPQQLEGYHGDKRKDTAEVIIPRKCVGSASNDIGFKKQADGSYAAIVSQFDSGTYNAAWFGKLKQEYGIQFAMQQAKRKGYRVSGAPKRLANGNVELSFMVG